MGGPTNDGHRLKAGSEVADIHSEEKHPVARKAEPSNGRGKRGKPRRSHRNGQPSPPEAQTQGPIDPLITPRFRELAAAVRDGNLTVEQMEERCELFAPEVPCELLPFICNLDFAVLATSIAEYPRLYWHPLVVQQLWHLLKLASSREEWTRLGWHWDEGETEPDEVTRIQQHMETLIAAHAGALFPWRRIEWKSTFRKPQGRQGGLDNPYPKDGAPTFITSSELSRVWRDLRDAFRKHTNGTRLEKRGEPHAQARERILQVAQTVADEHGPRWSRLLKVNFPPMPPDFDTFSLTLKHGWYIKHGSLRWSGYLGRVVDTLLEGTTLSHSQGAPAYLASAILAQALCVTPEKVYNAVNNHLHPRKQKPKRAPSG